MSQDGEVNDSNHDTDLRSRIWVNGQINDDWSYTGMLENTQILSDNAGNEDTEFKRAYVEGKLGGLNVTAGRYGAFFANGNIYDAQADGVEVSYGDKVKLTGFAGKATDAEVANEFGEASSASYGNYAGAELTAAMGNFNFMGGYVNFKDMYKDGWSDDTASGSYKQIGEGYDNAIWYVGGDYTMGDFVLSGMYLKGDASYKDEDVKGIGSDGWTAGLTYKGAEASEAGSWGLFANYYDQGGMTYVAHTTDANVFADYANDGFKGYGVGANYTFAKNIVGTVAYYDTESKLDSKVDDQRVWADVTFTF